MSFTARATLVLFGILFVMAGAVQVNDSDPFLWVSLYSFAAALSFAALVTAIPRWLIVCEALLAFAAFVVMSLVGFEWVLADSEEMRELGGIIVVFLHASILATVARDPHELWVDGRRLH